MRKFEKLLVENNIEYESNKDMATVCSFKAGGKAMFFIKPNSTSELSFVMKTIKECKIKSYILGNGTNTLVKDEGFNGAIISLKKMPRCLYKVENRIVASANINLFELNAFAKNSALKGLEFSYGIPGSVGGAIKMNAGAFGEGICDKIKSLQVLQDDKIVKINQEELEYSYRKCDLIGVVLECDFELEEGSFSEINAKQNEIYVSRKFKQPLDLPSAGSVFKRNSSVTPSKLIDELGLKGMFVGGAMVSTKHAGFIVNTGNAKASDIITLIEQIKSIAHSKLCLKFDQEIIII